MYQLFDINTDNPNGIPKVRHFTPKDDNFIFH